MTFDKLQSLWKENLNRTNLASATEIRLLANRYRKKMLLRNALTIGSLFLTIAFFIFGWMRFDLEPMAKAGLVVMSGAIVFYMVLLAKLVSFIAGRIDDTSHIRDYMQQLVRLQKSQQFIQHTGFILYGILLSFGMALYLYPFAIRNVTFGITVYGITFAYLLLSLTYIRKRTIPRDSAKLNAFIEVVKKSMKELE